MKVVHLSSSDLSGGASIACKRISDSLALNGVDSNLLVQKKISLDSRVQLITNNLLSRLHYNLRFSLDEGFIRLFTKQSRGRFTNPFVGLDISKHPLILHSDIIHLHWINGGYLSLNSLEKLKQLNKPIVWTLHDMWAFTGGCHYSLDCRKFEESCSNCPSLKFSGKKDASQRIFNNKSFFSDLNLTVVTCSKWLGDVAKKSSLFHDNKIINIPNPVDFQKFRPIDKTLSQKKIGLNPDKFYILFGAMNIIDERKGFKYLLDALKKIKSEFSNSKDKIEVLIFGKANETELKNIPFKYHYFGRFKDDEELIGCYNAADIFLVPSLQDNLPNTVLESLSCGTPVVAFNVGGIPDMIDHLSNGYLAKEKSVEDLINGIKWFVDNQNKLYAVKSNAREKIIKNFSREVVAKQYKELYTSLIQN